jgi:aldose 1-epimerase
VLELVNGGATCVVDVERGGRIASITVDGAELLVTRPVDGDPLSWGCYAMAPFAGRVRDSELHFAGRRYRLRSNSAPHSIHGTVFDRAWTTVQPPTRDISGVTASIATSVTARLTVELGPEWPFHGRVDALFRLHRTGIDLELTLHADETMPAQLGWHPWFVKPTESRLAFSHLLPRDTAGIASTTPVTAGELASGGLDDCFTGVATVDGRLGLTVAGRRLTLSSDCDHWVVYDQPHHATCLEPQSGPPNGVNDDPVIVRAGESLHRILTIDWA